MCLLLIMLASLRAYFTWFFHAQKKRGAALSANTFENLSDDFCRAQKAPKHDSHITSFRATEAIVVIVF